MRIDRGVLARLVRWVFREDAVSVSVRFASGEEATFRVVPDGMPSGLWISPLPVTTEELLSVLRGGPARRVVALRFDSGLLRRLSPPLVVAWSRLTPAPGAE